MEINFTNQEIIFIYGHFKKQISKLEDLKNTPNCSISKIDINNDIALFTSIIDKLKEANHNLGKLDNYRF